MGYYMEQLNGWYNNSGIITQRQLSIWNSAFIFSFLMGWESGWPLLSPRCSCPSLALQWCQSPTPNWDSIAWSENADWSYQLCDGVPMLWWLWDQTLMKLVERTRGPWVQQWPVSLFIAHDFEPWVRLKFSTWRIEATRGRILARHPHATDVVHVRATWRAI